MIDFTKPVQTKGGLPVRILATDLRSQAFPVAAAVMHAEVEAVHTFTAEGHWQSRRASSLDLENAPVTHKVTVYIHRRVARVDARYIRNAEPLRPGDVFPSRLPVIEGSELIAKEVITITEPASEPPVCLVPGCNCAARV